MSDSETEIQLGGAYSVHIDHIPDFFQYVALGHLHKPQTLKGATPIRYSGSPLAYSFSEARYKKSVTIIEAEPFQQVKYWEVPLSSGKPLIQKKVRNGLSELEGWLVEQKNRPAWIDIELHLEHHLSPEEIHRIRKLHDGIVNIRIVKPTQEESVEVMSLDERKPEELFTSFYQYRTGTLPKREVITLFHELFQLQNEEEDV